MDVFLDFLSNGFAHLSVGWIAIITLVMVQITIASVTLFLHRCQAHSAVVFKPVVSHFFRFWIWVTTGMITKEWVAVHRKHHATVETDEDPHSPKTHGIKKLLFDGVDLYRKESINDKTLERYGHNTPNDWVERHVYTPHPRVGITLMLIVDLVLFGSLGVAVWAIQMIWIPFFAAGIINGAGHYWGYRNYDTPDWSTNITWFAVFIGGEELHNNHHAFPKSAKFSQRWFEFDIGWLWLSLLQVSGLAKVKSISRKPILNPLKEEADIDTLKAVIGSRMHVLRAYYRDVFLPILREEASRLKFTRSTFRGVRKLFRQGDTVPSNSLRSPVRIALEAEQLKTVWSFRTKLTALLNERANSNEELVARLRQWHKEAKASGVEKLGQFADLIVKYVPAHS